MLGNTGPFLSYGHYSMKRELAYCFAITFACYGLIRLEVSQAITVICYTGGCILHLTALSSQGTFRYPLIYAFTFFCRIFFIIGSVMVEVVESICCCLILALPPSPDTIPAVLRPGPAEWLPAPGHPVSVNEFVPGFCAGF